MTDEQRYCRKFVARMFNNLPHTSWIPNANVSYSGGGVSQAAYESGRPDGFVFSKGKVLCVECKADFGTVYLGDPEKPEATAGWHYSQRNWYEKVAKSTATPYYIALWVYPEISPDKVFQEKARLFLVPPLAWLELETHGKRHPLHCEVKKAHQTGHFVEDHFWNWRLSHLNGEWEMPQNHPIRTQKIIA